MEKNRSLPYLPKHDNHQIHARRLELKEHFRKDSDRELGSPKLPKIFSAYLPKGGTILDLGSGNGRIFKIFHKLGYTNTNGADISDYLTAARPTSSFKTFDFSTDPFPYDDASFDGLTSIEVIEHLENPYHFLRECARILRPGGILILSTPNPDHFFNKLSFLIRGRFYRFLEGNDHIMLFSDPILRKGALKDFNLVAREYLFGEAPYRIFSKFKYPENAFFGRTAFYILAKK